MQIKDLKHNVRNPRKITDKKLDALKRSLAKYGDLSGFVFNRRTKTLVGGHQRSKVLPPDAQIKIEIKHEQPTKSRTVAEGYVLIDGERFKYREVDADPQWEAEALLAANKHSGEWDTGTLRLIMTDFPNLDIELAGFEMPELKAMNIEIPKISAPVYQAPTTHDEAYEVVEEETDEEYVANTPQTEEQIPTERIPSMVNDAPQSSQAYDEVQEKIETKNTKHLIIIDCPSQEVKESLREKLRADKFPEQHGVKLY